jgi:hypothetical protein
MFVDARDPLADIADLRAANATGSSGMVTILVVMGKR